MRLVRLTYEGAFHHGMNRGINAEAIFKETKTNLKDWGGLTYGEINKMPPFDGLKQGSLGKLYLDAKVRLEKDDQKK